MEFPDTAGANGRAGVAAAARGIGARSSIGLRATCRSQARTIDALGEAVSALRRGAAALRPRTRSCAPSTRV